MKLLVLIVVSGLSMVACHTKKPSNVTQETVPISDSSEPDHKSSLRTHIERESSITKKEFKPLPEVILGRKNLTGDFISCDTKGSLTFEKLNLDVSLAELEQLGYGYQVSITEAEKEGKISKFTYESGRKLLKIVRNISNNHRWNKELQACYENLNPVPRSAELLNAFTFIVSDPCTGDCLYKKKDVTKIIVDRFMKQHRYQLNSNDIMRLIETGYGVMGFKLNMIRNEETSKIKISTNNDKKYYHVDMRFSPAKAYLGGSSTNKAPTNSYFYFTSKERYFSKGDLLDLSSEYFEREWRNVPHNSKDLIKEIRNQSMKTIRFGQSLKKNPRLMSFHLEVVLLTLKTLSRQER